MTATAKAMPSEADRNYEAFVKELPALLGTHAGKFAVLHDGKIIEFFDSLSDAVRYGNAQFGPSKFSVQEVASKNVNLGFYSYALHQPAH